MQVRTYVRVAHPAYIKEKARELRGRKKLTIDELSERLALPRTTIYHWVRDLPIPVTHAEKLSQRRAARANKRNAKRLRDWAYDEGLDSFTWFYGEPTFRDFICLYIGEGFKRCRNTVALCNSDPAVMRLATSWIRRMTGDAVYFSLQYHADQNPTSLMDFWARELGVSANRIRHQRKSNSGQLSGRTWRCRYGVLTVASSHTFFRAELQAWMDCVQAEWD